MSSSLTAQPTIAKQAKPAPSVNKVRTLLRQSLKKGDLSAAPKIHAEFQAGRLVPDANCYLLLAICFRNRREERLRLRYANAAFELDPALEGLASTVAPLPPDPEAERTEDLNDTQPDDDVDYVKKLNKLCAEPDRFEAHLLHPDPKLVWSRVVDMEIRVVEAIVTVPLDSRRSARGVLSRHEKSVTGKGKARFRRGEDTSADGRAHMLAARRAARDSLRQVESLKKRLILVASETWAEGVSELLVGWRSAEYAERCDLALENAKKLVTDDRFGGLYGSTVLRYGSSTTGLTLGNSDVDIAVVLPMSESRQVEQEDRQKGKRADVLYFLEDWAHKTKIMCHVIVIDTAAVPVLKYHDKLAGVDVDITIGNRESTLLSRFVRRHLQVDTRIWELCMAVKYWARRRSVSNTRDGYINAIGWTIMTIFFLQHVVRPPIAALFRTRGLPTGTCPIVRVPWSSALKQERTENKKTTSELLCQFFQFFGEQFNYRQAAVSINCQCLADTLDVRKKGRGCRIFIEQPMEFGSNVVPHVGTDKLSKITRELRRAYECAVTTGNYQQVFEQREEDDDEMLFNSSEGPVWC